MHRDNKQNLELLFQKHNFNDYKWIKAEDIVIAQWVRMKCTFGCNGYGRASCPPNVGSIEDCRTFIREYHIAAIFHFEKETTKDNYDLNWATEICHQLLELEKAVFLVNYHKVFLMNMRPCHVCNTCLNDRLQCKSPELARPAPEA